MSTLKVTIIQSALHWHDSEANHRLFDRTLGATGDTDLIVLPEMFTTGFSMDAPVLAEPMNGPTVDWMRGQARAREAVVCGSVIIRHDDSYFNRFIAAEPSGELHCYDKRHLFRLANEQDHYAPGDRRIVFEVRGFRVCPMVCYDLRFPVWSRNRGDYDLLLYVANWPARRHQAWETLLRARAIENQCFVAGVNRSGRDGNDLPYLGGSAVIDYLGNDMANLGTGDGQATVEIDLADLARFRDRFAFHLDADTFVIE